MRPWTPGCAGWCIAYIGKPSSRARGACSWHTEMLLAENELFSWHPFSCCPFPTGYIFGSSLASILHQMFACLLLTCARRVAHICEDLFHPLTRVN